MEEEFVQMIKLSGWRYNIMRRSLQIIMLLNVLASCNFRSDSSEDRLQSLYKQRISHSNLVIYDFSFAGGFVTSSDHTGFAVLDSTISFSKDRMKELPCSYFAAVPTSSNFKMIKIAAVNSPINDSDTSLIPVRHFAERINEIQVKVVVYNATYGSPTSTGLMEYEFDRMNETADSLTFYEVSKIFGGQDFPATTSFVKGNIKVIDSIGDHINYIEIDQVIIKRGDMYKPTKPLELVANQPIIGIATYRFYPRQATKTTALTDYGIFKRVK